MSKPLLDLDLDAVPEEETQGTKGATHIPQNKGTDDPHQKECLTEGLIEKSN